MLARQFLTVAAMAAFSVVFASTAFGQSKTSSGMLGSRTTGTSASTGRSTTGSTSASGTSGAAAAGGSTGASAANPNVATTAPQNVASGLQTTQQRGAFVGADSADITNARSLQALNGQTGRATNNGASQLQNLFSQSLQQLNQSTQRTARPQIRVPLRMGFQPQPVSAAQGRRIEGTIGKLPAIRFIGPVQVEMQDRTAVLRGIVATEDDRRLAENLAKMEPEVLDVRNELRVDSTATAAEQLPPAAGP